MMKVDFFFFLFSSYKYGASVHAYMVCLPEPGMYLVLKLLELLHLFCLLLYVCYRSLILNGCRCCSSYYMSLFPAFPETNTIASFHSLQLKKLCHQDLTFFNSQPYGLGAMELKWRIELILCDQVPLESESMFLPQIAQLLGKLLVSIWLFAIHQFHY